MKKPLSVALIAGVLAVAVLVVGGILLVPTLASPPGPDASTIHVSQEEIARQRANPPVDEQPLPTFEGRPGAPERQPN